MSPDRRDRCRPEASPKQIDVQVGELLRLRREEVGLTVAELAQILEISADDLEAIESGRVRAGPKLVNAAAMALGVSVNWFFATW